MFGTVMEQNPKAIRTENKSQYRNAPCNGDLRHVTQHKNAIQLNHVH